MATSTFSPTSTFVPKQCLEKSPASYRRMVGDTTEQVASNLLTRLPPFPPSSVIHDNGCGVGAVTDAIMTAKPPPGPGITIHATDISDVMVKGYEKEAKAKGWPADATVMAAESLTFPDDTFDFSISNMCLAYTANEGTDAAKQILRTLKPNGTAIGTTWQKLPPQAPIKAAHIATRGASAPLPRDVPESWQTPEFLKSMFERAGFQESKIKMSTTDVYMEIKDTREWATLMWSFLGQRAGGWIQADEDNWDKALDIFVDGVESSDSYQKLESGGARLKFVANIAVATK